MNNRKPKSGGAGQKKAAVGGQKKSGGAGQKKGGRSRRRGGRKKPQNAPPQKVFTPKTYVLAIYDSQGAAVEDLTTLKAKANGCDRLNLVIRAETIVEEAKFESIENIQIYSGPTWTSVHVKRQEEGWYDEAH